MYLTYNDYKAMGGAVSFELYPRYEHRAEKMIDAYTFNRLQNVEYSNISQSVKWLVFELINLIAAEYDNKGNSHNGNILSEKVGDYSVSYAISEQTANYQQVISLMHYYLASEKTSDGISLMYSGVC